MKSLILTLICLLALAAVAEANPRPVALRGAAVARGAGIRNAARLANRVLFPGAAVRNLAFNQRFAFRNAHFAFRSHYAQPFAAYSAFSVAPFIQSYAAPVAFAAPAYAGYTQPYAAEVNPCGGAYTQSFAQPFAAYQAYGVLPFLSYASLGYGRFLGFNGSHGGYHRTSAFRFGR